MSIYREETLNQTQIYTRYVYKVMKTVKTAKQKRQTIDFFLFSALFSNLKTHVVECHVNIALQTSVFLQG